MSMSAPVTAEEAAPHPFVDEEEAAELGRTTWEEGQIRFGLIPKPEREETADQELKRRLDAKGAAGSSDEEKSDSELDEMDRAGKGSESVLEAIRRKRIAELKAAAAGKKTTDSASALSSAVKLIQDVDFEEEVKTVSQHCFVVMLVFRESHDASRVLEHALSQVALRHKTAGAKFCKMLASERLLNFPLADCPALMVYSKGRPVKQLATLSAFAGQATNADVVEWELSRVGVVKTELYADPREDIALEAAKAKARTGAGAGGAGGSSSSSSAGSGSGYKAAMTAQRRGFVGKPARALSDSDDD